MPLEINEVFGRDGVFQSKSMEETLLLKSFTYWGNIGLGSTIITLISLAITLLWDRPVMKKYTFFSVFSLCAGRQYW